MTRSGSPAAPVDGPRRLAWLTLLGAPAVVAGSVYALTGRGLPCPFLVMTGWSCPFCGGSRMGTALLVGDLGGAWGWNPFLLVIGIVLGLAGVWTLARVVCRRSAALPGPLARLDQLPPATWVWLFTIPAVVFGVVRNLL